MHTQMRARLARNLLLAGLVLTVVSSRPLARAQQVQPHPASPLPGATDQHEDDAMAARMAIQQAKGQNVERQKKLVNDTDRLLALATELKQQVSKSDKNTLSVDVIRKADEIEKLAHSVKERMKG